MFNEIFLVLTAEYAVQPGAKRDFEVGDELRVKCSSFSTKGVPVLSLVKEE